MPGFNSYWGTEMNKKDFFYLIIIAGLIAYIISDQESESTTDTQQSQQPAISKTKADIKADEPGDNHKSETSEPIASTTKNTEENKYSASQDPAFHKSSDLPQSSDESENKRTTAAALHQRSVNQITERFNKQRENEFEQAPPDAWGDDMRNEIETLYYTKVNQSDIEAFDAECKAKMCNINLTIDKGAEKSEFANISSNIFPSYPRQPSFVMTTISGNTITIKADFDEPITINDN